MSMYAQLNSGVILPRDLAKTVMAESLGLGGGFGQFGELGNNGAYRSASSRNKNTIGWLTTDGSADADTLADLPTLRRQSRDLARNEAIPAGVIARTATSVVGTGIIPQSRIDAEFLGITDEEATKWQAMAERIFNQLADKTHFDSERRQTFWQQQRTVQMSKLESGDVFAVRRFIEAPGKLLGLSVQIIEADRVATPLKYSTNERVRAGIEVDTNGGMSALHIMQEHPGDRSLTVDTKFTRVPLRDSQGDAMALAIIPRRRPGQSRGVPFLAPVIEPLKQLGRYTEAEIQAAVISGMFAVFVTSDAPAGLAPLGAGIPGQVGGQQIVPTGNGLTKMQSGMIVDLRPGEKIEVADSSRPNTAFEPFVAAVLTQIGIGLEIPPEVMMGKYSTSYTAARGAILEAWRFYFVERDFLVWSYCQPVWEWAITEAVARGLLKAPGFFDDPLKRAAWLKTQWVGQGMPRVDELKEANAATAWSALGVKSRQTITNEQGSDFASERNQIGLEEKQYGLLPAGTPPPEPEAPDDDNEAPPARTADPAPARTKKPRGRK